MPPSNRVVPRVYVSNLRYDVTKSEIRRAVYEYAGIDATLKDVKLVRMDDRNWRPQHCSCFLKIETASRLLLEKREKPLRAGYEDFYRRSRWEDPPHPQHLARPVSPPPRRQPANASSPSLSMPQNQPDGLVQHATMPEPMVQQWFQPSPQFDGQWNQAVSGSQAAFPVSTQAMGSSVWPTQTRMTQMEPMQTAFAAQPQCQQTGQWNQMAAQQFSSTMSTPDARQFNQTLQWQHPGQWNQMVPQQLSSSMPAQDDSQLNQALLAAIARRQFEELVARNQLPQGTVVSAQNKARPTSKASVHSQYAEPLQPARDHQDSAWQPPEITEEGTTEEELMSPANLSDLDLDDAALANELHSSLMEKDTVDRTEDSEIPAAASSHRAAGDGYELEATSPADEENSSEEANVNMPELLENLRKLNKQISKSLKKRRLT
eukprot:s3931_g8.t1